MLAIIGAGASGLRAAIEYKRAHPSGVVCIFERGQRAGRKLAATGNGRCNITAADPAVSHYHGMNPHFIQSALSRFPLENTIDFFTGIGVPLKPEGNKFFPYSLQASSVVDALRLECARLNIEIRTEQPVVGISRTKKGFSVQTPAQIFSAHAVLIACGGCASAALGGVTDGYTLLESFGHKRTALLPAIVQLRTNTEHAKALSGVKLDAAAQLCVDGKCIREERGEVLFADYGLSGPAILQLSGHAVRALAQKKQPVIAVDLLPDMEQDALLRHLKMRRSLRKDAAREQYLIGLVHNRVGLIAMKAAGFAPLSQSCASLSDEMLASLAKTLKSWPFTVMDHNGMKNAQVTAGGIDTRDFDPQTLQSRLCPNLFACGEVLDIDGDCGGYNLQWAWSSGALAGASIPDA